MYANVLKFHILIPHEKIGDPYYFLIPFISYFRVISLYKITLKSHIFVLLLLSWACRGTDFFYLPLTPMIDSFICTPFISERIIFKTAVISIAEVRYILMTLL